MSRRHVPRRPKRAEPPDGEVDSAAFDDLVVDTGPGVAIIAVASKRDKPAPPPALPGEEPDAGH
jgi:hypothetical protein